MYIRSVQSKEIWDDFILAQPDYTFLNSWAWGSFNEASDSKVWRLGMFEGDVLESVALVILVAARRGRFLFVPHGPISNFPTFVDYLKRLAREERCAFIRISPLLLKTSENEKMFRHAGFRQAPIHMHAETTWILDTTRPAEQLLADMRKTTRYLVRRGEKDGVEIASGNSPDLLCKFYELYTRTAVRQHFVPFSFDYIAREAAAFGEDGARVYLAKQESEVLAGALIVFYGDRAFYHHGASLHHPTASSLQSHTLLSPRHPVGVAHLLQWRIIQDCVRRGIKEYNFWGVDFRPKHPWAGVTLFKTGFGGSVREYVPAQDLPIHFSYWISFGIETLRRIRRRY